MELNKIDQPLVFVDIETTGMSPRTGGRIIEVGALRMEQGRVVATMNQLVDPECDIPYFITDMTGIGNDHVAAAPTFHQVIDQLHEITNGAIFVAHNVNFDYGFIQHEFARLDRSFVRPRLCTVRLSRALFPDVQGHSLGKLIERHDYRVAARHRAYDDAEVLHRFVSEMHTSNPRVTAHTISRLVQ